eukprot:scaffold178798_cov36-Tisochrysis_lutea.AAC.5
MGNACATSSTCESLASPIPQCRRTGEVDKRQLSSSAEGGSRAVTQPTEADRSRCLCILLSSFLYLLK